MRVGTAGLISTDQHRAPDGARTNTTGDAKVNLKEITKVIKEKVENLDELFPQEAVGAFKETILKNELLIELGDQYVEQHWPRLQWIIKMAVAIRKAVRGVNAARKAKS